MADWALNKLVNSGQGEDAAHPSLRTAKRQAHHRQGHQSISIHRWRMHPTRTDYAWKVPMLVLPKLPVAVVNIMIDPAKQNMTLMILGRAGGIISATSTPLTSAISVLEMRRCFVFGQGIQRPVEGVWSKSALRPYVNHPCRQDPSNCPITAICVDSAKGFGVHIW